MQRTVLAVLAACALALLIASPSAAQPGPRVEALPSAGAKISSSLTTPPPVARARRILAPGVAITASALIHVMWAIPTRPCGGFYERHQRLATHSLYAAAAIGAVGVLLLGPDCAISEKGFPGRSSVDHIELERVTTEALSRPSASE